MYVHLQWRKRRPWEQSWGRGGREGWDCEQTESNIKTDFYTQEAVVAITDDAGQRRAMAELTSLKPRLQERGLQPVEACKRLLVAPSMETRLSPMPGFARVSHIIKWPLQTDVCVLLGWVIVALETFICLHVALSLSALISQECISIWSPPFPNPLTFLRLFCEGKGELGPTAGTAPNWLSFCYSGLLNFSCSWCLKFLCCPGCKAM